MFKPPRSEEGVWGLVPKRVWRQPIVFSRFPLQLQDGVFHVRDEHVPRRMRDDKRRLGVHDDRLRGYAARPEDRHFALADRDRVAVIRVCKIVNADGLG